MKKLLLPLLILCAFAASAQTPLPGSTLINSRYKWLGGKFDQLKIPMYADTTQYPLWLPRVGGDMMLDTAGADAGVIYVRYNMYWHGVTGSGGTTDTSGYGYLTVQYPLILEGSGDTAYLRIDTTGLGGGGSGVATIFPYRNIDSLRLHSGIANGQGASTLGYVTPLDGGGASYYWDATSTATEDSVLTIKVAGVTTGRWRQVIALGTLNPKTGNVRGDGVTDDYYFINKVLTIAGTNGYIVQFPKGVFKHSKTLLPPQNIIVRGAGNRQTTFQITTDTIGMIISSSNVLENVRFFGGGVGTTGLLMNGGNKAFVNQVRFENFTWRGFANVNGQNSQFRDLFAQYNEINFYLDGVENCQYLNVNGNSDDGQGATASTLSIYIIGGCNNVHFDGGLVERGPGLRQIYVGGASVFISFLNMQFNGGTEECALVDDATAIFTQVQFSRGTNAWNVKTVGVNAKSNIVNCFTVGSNGLGNDKLYDGNTIFNGEAGVPLFGVNFAGSTAGSAIGGATLQANRVGQNMTVLTNQAAAGVGLGLGSGSGLLRPGQTIELEFTLKAIDDSGTVNLNVSKAAGGRDFMRAFPEGHHKAYYTARGYESVRFDFLIGRGGSHQFTISQFNGKLMGAGDSIPVARVTMPLQLGVYTPAVDTTAAGLELLNAKQTKALIAAAGGSGGAAVTAGDGITVASGVVAVDTTVTRNAAIQQISNKYLNANKFNGGSNVLQGGSFAFHNLAEPYTTNYERALFNWSGNVFTVQTQAGGTGTARNMLLQVNSKQQLQLTNAGTGFLILGNSTDAGTGSIWHKFLGTSTAASGMPHFNVISPTINQTSTAGYSALTISPYEQATGSGVKYLQRWGTNTAASFGGTHTDKMTVDNAGNLTLTGVLKPFTLQSASSTDSMLVKDGTTGEIKTRAQPTGGGGGSGTVNSGTANQLAYYAGTGAAVSGLTAITASRALASNASGLPVAATTTATELDYVSGVTSAIQTQLNTRVNFLSNSTASAASLTPTGSAKLNEYYVTAQAVAGAFAAPSGTPANGNALMVRIRDAGTVQTLTWNAIYEAPAGSALPTQTIVGESIYVQFFYNSTLSKWQSTGTVSSQANGPWVPSTTVGYYSPTRIGIGTNAPTDSFEVVGTSRLFGQIRTNMGPSGAAYGHIVSQAATGILSVVSREYRNITTTPLTNNTTLGNGDGTIRMNATAGALTATLPSAASACNNSFCSVYTIIKTDASANTVTVVGTINGTTNRVINTQNSGVTVQSNGTDWTIIGTF